VKVCLVMAGDEEGGLEKHFVELSNRLSKHMHVSVIAHPKYKDRFVDTASFYAIDLSKSRKNVWILFKLYYTIKSINPDIVHAHANKAVSMIATIKPFLPSSIKTIASLHSQKRNVSSYEKFDYVIGVSKRVLESLKLDAKRVVYNGVSSNYQHISPIDMSKFFETNLGFCICSVGRLEEVKNFALLIDACIDAKVNLVLVGDGSLYDTLQKQINSKQANSTIKLLGYRDDSVSIIASADVFVISSHREGMPYVLIESLLSKVPVISTDVSDMKYILPTEFVVPVDDKEVLTNAIIELKNNYTEKLNQYKNSFEFAKKHFSQDAMIEGVMSVYDEVMSR